MKTNDLDSKKVSTDTAAAVQPEPQQQPVLDLFDPARLRLAQNLMAGGAVKKLLTTVPVRKPAKEWFFQSHPSDDYRLDTYVIELKEEGETYLVDPTLYGELVGESSFGPRRLILSVNRQGTVFLWPLKLPSADMRNNTWNESAQQAADHATGHWVRVQANMNLGAYEVFQAESELGEPQWPTLSLGEILRIAFRGHLIDNHDHPVLKQLRGEV